MFKDSLWYPEDWKRLLLVLSVPVMIALHMSELVGLMNSQQLLFGWLPMQFAYDIGRGILAIVLIYAFATQAPDSSGNIETTGRSTDEPNQREVN